MMSAASRFPFSMDANIGSRQPGPRPQLDGSVPGSCYSVGLGIKSSDQLSVGTGKTNLSSQHSPWYVSPPTPAAQTVQPSQAQAPSFRPSSTAAQWIALSENGSPKSNGDLSSVQELNQKLEEKESVVCELKLQVEALMTAITMSRTGEVGSMDSAELVHRMLGRLKSLRNENERLMALASHNNAARLEIELDLLKQENAELRKRLSSP